MWHPSRGGGGNQYDDSYWPGDQSHYRPVRGYHGQRRHAADLSMPAPYGWTQFFNRPSTSEAPAPIVSDPEHKLYQDFNDPVRPAHIHVDYKCSAIKCEVTWEHPTLFRAVDYKFVVEASQEAQMETMELPRFKTSLKLRTVPGQWYVVEVRAISLADNRQLGFGRAEFRAVFSRDEMLMLHERAEDYVGRGDRNSMHPFRVIYRCKPRAYYDDIKHRTHGIMGKYLKDKNGQAASPINEVINGLFFSARLNPDGTVPSRSPFGNLRMIIPAESLLNPSRVRLYFSDFYCNYKQHYITVVVCDRGSDTDRFCERCLIPVDPETNPFLQIIDHGYGQYEYWVNKRVWVEIYYTEDVPLHLGRFDDISAVGAGTSKPGGLPHNKTCTECNLYPIVAPKNDVEYQEQMEERKRAADVAGEDLEAKSQSAKRAKRDERPEIEDVGISSTFHLVMEMERDRLCAVGKSAESIVDEVGETEVIDLLCGLIDKTVETVGETIPLPKHGYIGVSYRVLKSRWQAEAGLDSSTDSEVIVLSSETSDTDKAIAADEQQVATIMESTKENLVTEEGKSAYEKLQEATSDLDRRCMELHQTLMNLQASMLNLEQRIKPIR